MGSIAFLGLGANLGEPRAAISRAISMLGRDAAVKVVSCARMYRTRPLGPPGQPDYFNTAVKIETSLSPRQLLALVKRIEIELGRVPAERWGPRVIDVDILIYGSLVIDEPELRIPHV